MDLKSWLPSWALSHTAKPKPIGLSIEPLEDRVVPTVKFGTPTLASQSVFSPRAVALTDNTGKIIDINGDAAAELLIGHGGAYNGVTVQLGGTDKSGNPNGTFAVTGAGVLKFDTPSAVNAILVADINGDKRVDLVVGLNGTSPGIRIFPGLAAGDAALFDTTAANIVNITTASAVVALDLRDMNLNAKSAGKGGVSFFSSTRPELIAAENSGASGIEIFEGGAANSFAFGAGVSFATTAIPTSLSVTDFNGDGWLDIAVGEDTASSGIEIFENAKSFTTTAGSPTTFAPNAIAAATLNAPVAFSTAAGVNAIETGNLTAFGNRPGIIVGTSDLNNAIQFYANLIGGGGGGISTKSFSSSPETYNLSASVSDLAFFDADKDGRNDIIAAINSSPTRGVQVLPGVTGSTSFGSRLNVNDGGLASNVDRFFAFADLNGDNFQDMVLVANVTKNSNQSWILNTSNIPNPPPPPPPPLTPPTAPITITAEQRFLDKLYRDLINRGIDGGGLAFWTAQLQSGASRQSIAASLANSPEALAVQVRRAYQEFLGRDGDEGGVGYFVQLLQVGFSMSEVEAAIVLAPEFSAQAGGFLGNLYFRGLKREIDSSGIAYWTGMLESGRLSAFDVAATILFGPERAAIVVNFGGTGNGDIGLYQRYLSKNGDVAGSAFWRDLLASRIISRQTVISAFVATDEYLVNASR